MICMLSPAGWLPRVRDQLRPLMLDIYKYGYLYLYLFYNLSQGAVTACVSMLASDIGRVPQSARRLQRSDIRHISAYGQRHAGLLPWVSRYCRAVGRGTGCFLLCVASVIVDVWNVWDEVPAAQFFLLCVASVLVICPIAIAYSMGQIIKSVCVCQCICPSASTLTVAFLDRFSQKLAET